MNVTFSVQADAPGDITVPSAITPTGGVDVAQGICTLQGMVPSSRDTCKCECCCVLAS